MGLQPTGAKPNPLPATALTVPTASAMPEAATHAVGKATAHAMAETVPEFMVLGAVASVIR